MVSEDVLRTALAELADQAGPPEFTAEPLIRAAARRRARFAAASGLCALAVAAAVAVPAALHGGPPAVGLGASHPPAAAVGRWDAEFICGEPLPGGLPGDSGDGLRIVIGSVTRTASGAPAVRWYLSGTPAAGPRPSIAAISAGVLVVGGGEIVSAAPAPAPVLANVTPWHGAAVPSADLNEDAPVVFGGGPGSWAPVWQNHGDFRVIVVATVWTESGRSPVALRFSATAPLPAG
jgi:hypothetical protein